MLSRDTALPIELRQVERWRAMTPAEKLHLASSASAAVRELAAAGLRLRHPSACDREIFLRYALLTLGTEAAVMVYPDARSLVGTVTDSMPELLGIATEVADAIAGASVLDQSQLQRRAAVKQSGDQH